jgi:dGTPase
MTSTILSEPAARPVAPYACQADHSRGRLVSEPEDAIRTPFQRDRDRIIHSSAFRRLTHKTQVFIYHEGDHYRTRLTHSLEVAQIARSLARALRLDEDLAEAIALAHDLGHTPFGHSGEEAVDEAMRAFGGFDHNAQSLRAVTILERRYARFDGLNLTWETLEGIVKHNGPILTPDGAPAGRYRENGVQDFVLNYNSRHDLDLHTFASAEAQAAAIADEIAYNNHDLDDGLRAGFFSVRELSDVPLTGRLIRDLKTRHGALPQKRLIYEMSRRLVAVLIHDVLAETERRLKGLAPRSASDIRTAGAPVAAFSSEVLADLLAIRKFLFRQVYWNPRIVEIMERAKTIVRDLFSHYFERPQELPGDWRPDAETLPPDLRARRVCDFVAGMTDRYAMEAHKRLFGSTPELR